MKVGVIVNPNAARGRGQKVWQALERRARNLLGSYELARTERPGHAVQLARELAHSGCSRLVGVGGDGTFNEIVNGLLEDDLPVNPELVLGLVPIGTGGDYQRSLELPKDPLQALQVAIVGRPVTIDVGKVSFHDASGSLSFRYFANLTSIGIGGEVAARAHNRLAVLGGKTSFFWATVQVIATFKGKPVRVSFDDGPEYRYQILNIAIGNGRFHGGGMYVCPLARLDDGWLDVTVIEHLGLKILLRDLRYLYSGNIYEHPLCHHFRARKIVARSDELTRLEIDGEPLGCLPAEVVVLPSRLRLALA